MRLGLILAGIVLAACTPSAEMEPPMKISSWEDLSKRSKPSAITTEPWAEAVVSVSKFEDIAPFFTQIAGYETLEKTDTEWLLGAPGTDNGFIRLVLNPNPKALPARPAESRSWDTGCYWSIMMRAKNLPSIIEDAKALGWTPLTELALLDFPPSKLNVIVLTHDSGVRVQLYERLTTPLPEGFPAFERVSRPFNIMQMVKDTNTSYDFFQQGLGFENFYYGKPFLSKEEEVMPIGLPPELTTTIPYQAAILQPFKGAEWGRVEVIAFDGMTDGVDYSERCNLEHTGIISIRFPVEDIHANRKNLRARKIDILGSSANTLSVKTPDGANIEFYQK